MRSIRAVLLLCTFTGCFSHHKAFLHRTFPLSWESPTFCPCTPPHSACAVPNGTARSFCLRDGVNCPMSTRARASGHVNQHWSSDCAWRVAETTISEGFCDTAVRGVGSGWHFAPPPPRTAVMIMFFFVLVQVLRCSFARGSVTRWCSLM